MEEKDAAQAELTSGKKEEDKQKILLNPQDITIDLKFNTAEGLLNKKNKLPDILVTNNKDNILDNKHDISDLPKPRYFFFKFIKEFIHPFFEKFIKH